MVTTSYRSAPELETKRPIEDWFSTFSRMDCTGYSPAICTN
jgi:hypothetical protein